MSVSASSRRPSSPTSQPQIVKPPLSPAERAAFREVGEDTVSLENEHMPLDVCHEKSLSIIDKIRQLRTTAADKMDHLRWMVKALFVRAHAPGTTADDKQAVAGIVNETVVQEMITLREDDPEKFEENLTLIRRDLDALQPSEPPEIEAVSTQIGRVVELGGNVAKAHAAVLDAVQDESGDQTEKKHRIWLAFDALAKAIHALYETVDADQSNALDDPVAWHAFKLVLTQYALPAFHELKESSVDQLTQEQLEGWITDTNERLKHIGPKPLASTYDEIDHAIRHLPRDTNECGWTCITIVAAIQKLPDEPVDNDHDVQFTLLARLADALVDRIDPPESPASSVSPVELSMVCNVLDEHVLASIDERKIPTNGYKRDKIRNIEGWSAWAGQRLPNDPGWEVGIDSFVESIFAGPLQSWKDNILPQVMEGTARQGITTTAQKFDYLTRIADELVQQIEYSINTSSYTPQSEEAAEKIALAIDALESITPAMQALIRQSDEEARDLMTRRLGNVQARKAWSKKILMPAVDVPRMTPPPVVEKFSDVGAFSGDLKAECDTLVQDLLADGKREGFKGASGKFNAVDQVVNRIAERIAELTATAPNEKVTAPELRKMRAVLNFTLRPAVEILSEYKDNLPSDQLRIVEMLNRVNSLAQQISENLP